MNNIPVELARRRKIRERNPVGYRLAHWLIWIWVCYITPGPLTFDLFARGFDLRMAAWLGVVLAATGVAGLRGRLPGVEARPYIIRFTEDKPNPVYRRVCYTLAWSDVVTFALLNLSSLVVTIMTGGWYLRQSVRDRVLPAGRHDLDSGRGGHAAARQAINRGRAARASLLLRCGVGRVSGTAGAVAVVGRAAANARGRRGEARRLRGRSGGRGVDGVPRNAPAHPVHSAWRACDQRLEYNPYEPLGAGQRPCGQ